MTEAFARRDGAAVEWRVETRPVDYATAIQKMEARVAAIRDGTAPEWVWLLEHPPLYTAGTSAGSDLPDVPLPLHRTGRGGQITYHGPGQRVAYLMLDLERRSRDIRAFAAALETWIIAALAAFAIRGERRAGRVGVWVTRPDKPSGALGDPAEDKIAAVGIRIRRWVTFHGVALNVAPNLDHYRGIVPCGIIDAHLGITSLADLGIEAAMTDVDEALRDAFQPIFGAATTPALVQRDGAERRGSG